MSEVVRRTKVMFLFVEMIMMLGVPAPQRLIGLVQRFATWRWQRQRRRALPRRTRGYERLVRRNPGLLAQSVTQPTRRRIATR